MTTHSDRELDVVLLGATGFVGRLTAAHLARHAPTGTRVGLAGRSYERLASLRDELGESATDWPTVVVDVTDDEALSQLAHRTRVVATTVGPYAPRGLPVVTACARAGTHYTDLTGETLFVRDSIAAAHVLARGTEAKIVHACGFDSIPSDLGVGLTAARAAADGAGGLTTAVLHVRSFRGGISGGTIDSLRQQVLQLKSDLELRPLVSDPLTLTLDQPALGVRPERTPHPSVQRDADTGRWHAPFVMGGFNRQIVQRSNALTGWSYGPGFSYCEVIDTGRGPAGAVAAAGVLAGSTALAAGMWFDPSRAVLDRVLPDPGEGPSERTRQQGRFVVEVDSGTEQGGRYRTTVAAQHDPGYNGTAVMLGESALSLASDPLDDRAGVLTPMVAMGDALADRLRARGFRVTTRTV